MRILIDTSVWSLALRRRPHHLSDHERSLVDELAELAREGRAAMIGTVRQEVLSGIRSDSAFQQMRLRLRNFPDESIAVDDHEQAAQHANTCLRAGVAGSPIDFLLCAVASRHDLPIFTTDADFERYAKHISIRLHQPRHQS